MSSVMHPKCTAGKSTFSEDDDHVGEVRKKCFLWLESNLRPSRYTAGVCLIVSFQCACTSLTTTMPECEASIVWKKWQEVNVCEPESELCKASALATLLLLCSSVSMPLGTGLAFNSYLCWSLIRVVWCSVFTLMPSLFSKIIPVIVSVNRGFALLSGLLRVRQRYYVLPVL